MDFNKLRVPALNITDYDRVFHLSYVDLDGFSCSTLVHKAREGNVWQINAEYSTGVDKAINRLVAKGKTFREGTLLILITDLYITEEQRAKLDAVNTGNVDVRVISNHHIEDSALEDYPSWYYTNTNVSSTALLYAAIRVPSTTNISYLEEFVRAVSAYDTHDRTNWTVFAHGSVINDGMHIFLKKLKKDDDYTRDVLIEFLTEIAKIIEEVVFGFKGVATEIDGLGVSYGSPIYIESRVIEAWRKAVGASGTETVVNALARNLATRVLEDKDSRYNIKLDDVVYRCAVVGVLPFEPFMSNEVLYSDVNDVDLIVSIDTDEYNVFVCSKKGERTKLFYEHFDASDILDAVKDEGFYTAIESLGFVKSDL